MNERRVLLGVVSWGWVALGVLPIVLLGDRLPAPVAIHWGASGRADGAGTLSALVGITLLLTAVPAAVATVVLLRAPGLRGTVVVPMAIATFIGSFGALIALVVVRANLDAATWTDARDVSGLGAGAVAGAALVAAAVVGRVARRLEVARPPGSSAPDGEPLPVVAERQWSGSASARWPWILIVIDGGAGLVLLASGSPWLGALLLLTALVGLVFTSVHVTVDERGLRCEMGAVGWPVVRFALDEITGVAAADIRPIDWGGWGYRGSVRLLRRAALVLRAGPAIVVDLGERRFAVTVDDARRGAAVLDALRRRPPH